VVVCVVVVILVVVVEEETIEVEVTVVELVIVDVLVDAPSVVEVLDGGVNVVVVEVVWVLVPGGSLTKTVTTFPD
jgi:hypothetical protein